MLNSNLSEEPGRKVQNRLSSFLGRLLSRTLEGQPVSKFWFALVGITGLAALWFTGVMCEDAFRYMILSSEAPAQIEKWGVAELSSSEYAVFAEYAYEIEGKQYRGKTIFTTRSYLNSYAAEKGLPNWQRQYWKVWYSSWKPSFSSLQRNFSLKSSVRALLAAGVCLYFLTLKKSFKKES